MLVLKKLAELICKKIVLKINENLSNDTQHDTRLFKVFVVHNI